MTVKTMHNSVDAYTDKSKPSTNFTGTKKLYVKLDGADQKDAYIYFTRPFPIGARIISAKLILRNGTALDGPNTRVDVRRISTPWRADKITWNNKPDAAGEIFSTIKSGAVSPEAHWNFNVKNEMQKVANGEVEFYGWKFTCNDGVGDWFYGVAAGDADKRPTMEIEWVIPLNPPVNLEPGNGRTLATDNPLLTFDYDSESDIDAVTIYYAPDNGSGTGPNNGAVATSAWIPTSDPQLYLSEAGFGPVPAGERRWWNAKIKTLDGQESAPGEWEDFFYQAPPGLVIDEPSGDVVNSSTPTVSWTVTGTTQVHYQVQLIDPNAGPEAVIWTNGRTTGIDTELTLPANLLDLGREYKIRVIVWDNIDRSGNGGFPPYSVAEKTVTVVFVNTETPVDSLDANRVEPWHWTHLTWDRAIAPDYFDIYMGSVAVARLEPDDCVEGSGYGFTARTAQPRTPTTWTVVAVTNGEGSDDNPTITTNYRPTSSYISEVDGSDPLMFLNYDRDQAKEPNSTVHQPIDGPPVLIKQGNSRIVGSFSGWLTGDAQPGLTALQEKERCEKLFAGEGRDILLTVLDTTVIGFVTNTQITSFSDPAGITYFVSFDYYQTRLK